MKKKQVMKKPKFKSSGRVGLFDNADKSSKLSKLGNPLEKLHKVINFEMFRSELEERILNLGLLVNEGKIVDASFVEVPRQRNTKEENQKIKSGEGSDLWDDKPYKKRQKDIDARWTEKGGQKFYGYKDHTKIDAKSKFIDTYEVTTASVHDSQPLENLLRDEEDKGQELYADSAYFGEPINQMLRTKNIKPQIIERAVRNNPLTDEQEILNNGKSKIRCRVEHVFGFVSNSMNEFYIRNIGFQRAKGIIGLINLVYNMCRYEQIVRLNLVPIKQ
jgi:IS5 family transposase